MKRIKLLKTFLQIAWKISKSYFFLILLSALFNTIQVFTIVYFPKLIIDALSLTNNRALVVTIIALIVIGLNLIINFVNKTIQRLLSLKNMEVEERFLELLGKKIMSIKYQHIEDPYYLDLKERALFASNNQGALRGILTIMAQMVKDIITIVGLVAILFSLNKIVLVILAGAVILTSLINRYLYDYKERFFQRLIPINRQYNYYLSFVINKEIAKDIRLYHMNGLIVDKLDEFSQKIFRDEFFPFLKKQGIVSGLTTIIFNLQFAFVHLYLARRVFKGFLTLGNFSLFTMSAINFTNSMNSLFESSFYFKQLLSYLDPFIEFMQLPEEKREKGKTRFSGEVTKIEFKNVSFKYPRSDKLVLDNVSFVIEKGEKISIVGLNGAGKTTLIKLLCRLYEPISGHIYINDIDIFDYEYQSYNKAISVVFQDYRLFDFTILENIALTEKVNEEKVNQVIEEVDLTNTINRLPNKINTHLNKEFDSDGTDLSGGEKQKLAIARALYKNSSLVILDEPTSALDPIAEAEIYEKFNELVSDKTALYISHRLSSSKFCDKVLIINQGRVQDFAHHDQLMKKEDSLYYQLFNTQAKNYQV